MSHYEYKVVTAPSTLFEYRVIPAPSKGKRGGILKSPEDRFANAIQETLNSVAAEGWEYVRAELLPSEERQGLKSTHIVYRSVLVFRRLSENQRVATPPESARPPEPMPEQREHTPQVPENEKVTPAAQTVAAQTVTTPPPQTPNVDAQFDPDDDILFPSAPKEPLTAKAKENPDAPPVFLRAKIDKK